MGDPTVDRYHCYECGSENVAFASLYPLNGVQATNGQGHVFNLTGLKYSKDFNVCAECCYDQRRRMYPNEDVPLAVTSRMEG